MILEQAPPLREDHTPKIVTHSVRRIETAAGVLRFLDDLFNDASIPREDQLASAKAAVAEFLLRAREALASPPTQVERRGKGAVVSSGQHVSQAGSWIAEDEAVADQLQESQRKSGAGEPSADKGAPSSGASTASKAPHAAAKSVPK